MHIIVNCKRIGDDHLIILGCAIYIHYKRVHDISVLFIG